MSKLINKKRMIAVFILALLFAVTSVIVFIACDLFIVDDIVYTLVDAAVVRSGIHKNPNGHMTLEFTNDRSKASMSLNDTSEGKNNTKREYIINYIKIFTVGKYTLVRKVNDWSSSNRTNELSPAMAALNERIAANMRVSSTIEALWEIDDGWIIYSIYEYRRMKNDPLYEDQLLSSGRIDPHGRVYELDSM